MISRIPPFMRGIQFKELAPSRSQYRFETLRAVTVPLDRQPVAGSLSCRDKEHREWLRIDEAGLTISAGYAWNGCSPKRHVWPFGWIGTPDFPGTHLASLFHDALYQFRHVDHFPFDRATCDEIFRQLLTLGGARIANTYFGAVRDMGWIRFPWQVPNGDYGILNPPNDAPPDSPPRAIVVTSQP